MITSPDFCETIYSQLHQGVAANLGPIACMLPVASAASNQIALAARKSECTLAPHAIRLSRHPSGAITAGIESPLGLACPDPLVVMGEPVAEVKKSAPPATNHSNLVIVSSPNKIFAIGRDFDDEFSPVRGVHHEHQKLFFAQVAGLVLKRSLQAEPKQGS